MTAFPVPSELVPETEILTDTITRPDHPVLQAEPQVVYPACPVPPSGFYSAADLALPIAGGAVLGLLLALIVVVTVFSRHLPRQPF